MCLQSNSGLIWQRFRNGLVLARSLRLRFSIEESARPPASQLKEVAVLYYAVVFFIVALIAALFGFGGIAAGAAGIAKILFIIFLIVSIVTFLMSLARK
jgi:uncharacterized membrane protein YtjA (UPF0391 family)